MPTFGDNISLAAGASSQNLFADTAYNKVNQGTTLRINLASVSTNDGASGANLKQTFAVGNTVYADAVPLGARNIVSKGRHLRLLQCYALAIALAVAVDALRAGARLRGLQISASSLHNVFNLRIVDRVFLTAALVTYGPWFVNFFSKMSTTISSVNLLPFVRERYSATMSKSFM